MKKQFVKKAIAAVLTAAMVLLSLGFVSGCSFNENKPIDLVLIIGYRANSPVPSVSAIRDEVTEAIKSFGSICVINVDGGVTSPNGVYKINKPDEFLTKQKLEEIADQQFAQLMPAITGTRAEEEEADLMAAFTLAARYLNSVDRDSEKRILVIDSGLATAGDVNFTRGNLIDVEPDVISRSLENNRALPALNGVQIRWLYIGDTVEPQNKLTGYSCDRLETIWQNILETAGASVIFDTTPPLTSDAPEDLPSVTPVKIVSSDLNDLLNSGIVRLDEDEFPSVRFQPDSDELIDRSAAMEELKVIAEDLKATGVPIVLAGTTARTVDSNVKYCRSLGLKRSKKVRELLIELGVDQNQIRAVGLGFDHDYYINDQNTDGTQNETIARKNRSVLIITDSEESADDYAYVLAEGTVR